MRFSVTFFWFVTLKKYICTEIVLTLKNMTMEELNFTTLYNEYRPLVMARLRTKVRNSGEIEDVCHDIFVKIFRFLGSYDCSKAQLNTWVFTIVNNYLTDDYRKKALAVADDNESNMFTATSDFVDSEGNEFFESASSVSASDQIENKELHRKIRRAIRGLKQNEKRVAILRLVKDYEYAEIAEIMDVPINSVKVYISRAKEALQIVLKSEYASI